MKWPWREFLLGCFGVLLIGIGGPVFLGSIVAMFIDPQWFGLLFIAAGGGAALVGTALLWEAVN